MIKNKILLLLVMFSFQQLASQEISQHPNLSFNVVLEPQHLTVIFTQITSPILKIYKQMGDEFEKDEILMELDDKVFKANRAKSKASVDKFQAELDAKKVLFEDDAMSRFELEDANASLASSTADLMEADKLLECTKIKAPYKGKVARLAVQEFELAQQGKELIQLVDSDILYAKFLVPSILMPCLEIGAPVEIQIREIKQLISTKISRIAPIIDPTSSTIKVEAEIENHDNKLWAGMTGLVKIQECN